VTLTLVPNGRVLWAAVRALGLNLSPLAVILCLLHSPGFTQSYHDAFTLPASAVGTLNNMNPTASNENNNFDITIPFRSK
jgi:hypothetical protein